METLGRAKFEHQIKIKADSLFALSKQNIVEQLNENEKKNTLKATPTWLNVWQTWATERKVNIGWYEIRKRETNEHYFTLIRMKMIWRSKLECSYLSFSFKKKLLCNETYIYRILSASLSVFIFTEMLGFCLCGEIYRGRFVRGELSVGRVVLIPKYPFYVLKKKDSVSKERSNISALITRSLASGRNEIHKKTKKYTNLMSTKKHNRSLKAWSSLWKLSNDIK